MLTLVESVESIDLNAIRLPCGLLIEIEEFINENKNLGYVTKEDFLRDAARQRLQDLKDKAQA